MRLIAILVAVYVPLDGAQLCAAAKRFLSVFPGSNFEVVTHDEKFHPGDLCGIGSGACGKSAIPFLNSQILNRVSSAV